jgi:hypothetical protein
MRKAAGIILMVSGIVLVAGMIIDVINYEIPTTRMSMLMGTLPYTIVFGGLLVAGGVYCFKRRYWGLCLVSAVVPLSLWITPVAVSLVAVVAEGSLEGALSSWLSLWRVWIVVLGTLISTIFISIRKKEWQKISGSVDGEVSKGG